VKVPIKNFKVDLEIPSYLRQGQIDITFAFDETLQLSYEAFFSQISCFQDI